jgi:hypothetical protein
MLYPQGGFRSGYEAISEFIFQFLPRFKDGILPARKFLSD